MKRDRLCQSLGYLLIGFVVFACVSISWADGVKVEVPYAVTSAQWWTGVAIKNLDESSATATLKIEFFSKRGSLLGAVEIDSLKPQEIFCEVTSTIYPASLPVNYSIKVSQSGNEELAVTVFVGNSATGGFSYQTYNSQVCSQALAALPSWDQKLPVDERFVLVFDEEAVLDRETGLVWERVTRDHELQWDQAQYYCYQLKIADRKGWRLPTIDELATLIDSSQFAPALPDGHPFTIPSGYYWSSTSHASFTDSAWCVNFSTCDIYHQNKSKFYYVRAVRSGQ